MMKAAVTRGLQRALNGIERVGNRLPEPVSLFAVLIVIVMVASALAAAGGVSVQHPTSGKTVAAVNLFAGDLLRRLLVEMSETFAAFPPLGLVLVVMLGIGIADKSGLLGTALKLLVGKMPAGLLSGTLVFAGIMSSLAADAGYVILIPLGAAMFYAVGRHPLAGMAATFAGVSAGFSANLLLTAIDPLLAGLTQAGARLLEPDYTVAITANYYLMLTLVPALTLAGTWVSERLVEPYLGDYRPGGGSGRAGPEAETTALDPREVRGLQAAGLTVLAWLGVVLWMVLPEDGILRADDGGLAPLYQSLVALMMIGFLLPGLVYGIAVGRIRRDRDAVGMAGDSMADMGHYIVLAFMAAHLIVLFEWSNLGVIIAVKSAQVLEQLQWPAFLLIAAFMLVTGLINLLIGSASAKWALMAPVFVPMFMLLGYPPELTQAAYRIADSVTNVLTPLMPYFPLVIVFGRKYRPDFGIGSLVALMLPYSLAFGLTATALLWLWMTAGWPLGPGN